MNASANPPRSGVSGLTPLQIRLEMIRNGWGVLPLLAHDARKKSAGKAPGNRGWEFWAKYEAPLPRRDDLDLWDRRVRDWPGTGIPCGAIVGVDLDFGSDPHLADRAYRITVETLGETAFIRQGKAPKRALLYRAAEPIESTSLKTLDGSGDGLDILATGRQVVAFGIHPKTHEPYRWIGPESPLTASPDAAPAVTAAQIATLIERLRGLVELSKTGGRKREGGKGTGGGEIIRGPDFRVIDGREWHLTRTVYAAAVALKAEGQSLDVAALTERAWAEFAATTVLDDGKWTRRDAAGKAVALIDRVRRGITKIGGTEPKAAAPSYADTRRPIFEAETAAANVVSRFFAEHVQAWRRAVRAEEDPVPVSWGARLETAIGKTALAIAATATAARQGLVVVYAVPTHKLGAELIERFAAEGVEARVYRGYEADDPDSDGAKMCLDLRALEDAKESGVGSIKSSVCERRTDGELIRCALFDQCGMTRQRQAKPAVWLVPHALLMSERPAYIPAPDALVIDEGIVSGAIPDKPVKFSLDAMEQSDCTVRSGPVLLMDATNDLETFRADFMRALRDHDGDGPLRRDILTKHRVTREKVASAYKLEWQRVLDPEITPGMDAKKRRRLAKDAGRHNAVVRLWAGIWVELRTFLEGEAAESGRLRLRYNPDTENRALERRSLGTIRKTWKAPALLLDATLPRAELLEPVLGHKVEIRADVSAHWSRHGRVRQIIGAPVSASKLGIVEGKEPESDKRAIGELMRLIRLRAALVTPGRIVAVIAQKALIERLRAAGFPSNVEAGHFGAVAGLDRWKDAAGLICIGRPLPDPRAIETAAGVVTGVPPVLAPTENGFTWYERITGGIRLASGGGVAVEWCRHPDPIAEVLRWQACEANLVQAIGRLRALRRPGPFFLDIVSDVPLPISVDVVTTWEKALPGRWADMAGTGVLLSSAADIQAAYPDLAPSREAARQLGDLSLVGTSIREIPIDVPTNVRAVSYKRHGRFAPADALVLPNAPADLKAWLEARLSPIEWVRPAPGGDVEPDIPAHIAALNRLFDKAASPTAPRRPSPFACIEIEADTPRPPDHRTPTFRSFMEALHG